MFYFVEVIEDSIISKLKMNSSTKSETMYSWTSVTKEIYNKLTDLPAKIERDNQGKIIDAIPIEKPKKPVSEETQMETESKESIKIKALEIKVKRLEEMIDKRG